MLLSRSKMKLNFDWGYYFDFVFLLTKKEIKSRYKRTLLGFLWVVLNPIFQMLIIGFIFQYLIPIKIENYFLFLMGGLLPWNFFTNSILRTTPLLVMERSLIQKAAFPREIMVAAAVLANLFHSLIATLVFLIFLAILKANILASLGFLLTSLGLLTLLYGFLLIFTLATSLILAALYVKFRDLIFIVQLFIQLIFYGVPIIYSLEMLPVFLRNLLYFNPLVSFIEVFRSITLGSIFNVLAASLVASFFLIYLLFGIFFFKKESKNFDDWF